MITTLIIIYILSIVGGYMAIRHIHKTMFTSSDPNLTDVISLFIPILNTMFSVVYIIACINTIKINTRKFFKL